MTLHEKRPAFPQGDDQTYGLSKLEWMTGMVLSGLNCNAWESTSELTSTAVEIAKAALEKANKNES